MVNGNLVVALDPLMVLATKTNMHTRPSGYHLYLLHCRMGCLSKSFDFSITLISIMLTLLAMVAKLSVLEATVYGARLLNIHDLRASAFANQLLNILQICI